MIKKINFKPKRLKFMKKTAFPDTTLNCMNLSNVEHEISA
jgi:hypothetical protein